MPGIPIALCPADTRLCASADVVASTVHATCTETSAPVSAKERLMAAIPDATIATFCSTQEYILFTILLGFQSVDPHMRMVVQLRH